MLQMKQLELPLHQQLYSQHWTHMNLGGGLVDGPTICFESLILSHTPQKSVYSVKDIV